MRTGAFEHWRVTQHDLGFHYNNTILGSYSCSDSVTNLSQRLLYRALREVIKKHPAPSAVVRGKDTPNPYFARLDEVNLDKVVSFQAATPTGKEERSKWIEDLLSEQNSHGFDADDSPLWRI